MSDKLKGFNVLEAELLGEINRSYIDIDGDLSQDGILHYDKDNEKVIVIPADDDLDAESQNVVKNSAVAGAVEQLNNDIAVVRDVKQDKLSQAQLDAVNSGIDAGKVGQISQNTLDIGSLKVHKQDKLSAGDNIKIENNIISVYGVLTEAVVANKADKSEALGSIEMTINPLTYVLTIQAKNVNGQNVGNPQTADLPLESIIVSAIYYNSYTYSGTTYSKVIVITLATTDIPTIIPVGDLVSGLQNEITSQNKLSADLVNDTNTTNKFVTSAEKTQIATNTSNISAIKDGTNIDSFADVETALAGKQATIDSSNKLDADLIDDTNSTNKMVTENEKQGWSGKQDALTTSSVNDGTIDKAIGFDGNGNLVKGQAGSNIEIDNESITTNSDDELQAEGIIDQNTGNTDKVWTGTQQQYDAIIEKDPNTTYLITDAPSGYSAGNGIDITNDTISNTAVLTGTTAPTTATVGYVGQFYLDTVTAKLYKCDAIVSGTPDTYTWSEVGGGGQLYQHNIMLYSVVGNVYLMVINNDSTPFTNTTLKSHLKATTTIYNAHIANGIYQNNAVMGIYVLSDDKWMLKYFSFNSTNNNFYAGNTQATLSIDTDVVSQIL